METCGNQVILHIGIVGRLNWVNADLTRRNLALFVSRREAGWFATACSIGGN